MVNDNLKSKATHGAIWATLQKFSTMGVSFISGIILARLLAPDDYGCIGMLAIFMALAENFIDGGFGSALIQKKKPTQNDYDTVFFFNIAMSVLLYAIIFFASPLVAKFYNMPLLSDVLRWQGLVLFIYALSVIQSNQIRKYLDFKKLAKIQIASSVLTLGITIYFAYSGYGVWALVIQNIVAAFIPCVLYWITSKWRPKLNFSWTSFKELFGFGSFMFLTHILRTLSSKISGLLIGKYYTASTMGYYSRAEHTSDIATMSISSVLIQITYPLYSAVQDDKERLINIIKHITTTLSFFTTPLMCLLILIAKPLFLLLFTETWLPCVPYFQVLCVAGIASCLQAVNYQAISAIGKSKVMFGWEIVKRALGIALQVGGLILFGLKGLLVGNVISAWFAYFINITMVSNHVGYKNYQQIKDLSPTFIVSFISVILSYFSVELFNLSVYIDGLVKTAVFLFIYVIWALWFKPDAYIYAMSVVKSIIKK